VAGTALRRVGLSREPAQTTALNSLDASGRIGGVRFFASGAYTTTKGAISQYERAAVAASARQSRL